MTPTMKQTSISILLTILFNIVGTKTFAYDIEVKNSDGVTFYCNYINDGSELEIAGCIHNGSVIIPEELTFMNRTRKVTAIGSSAFLGYNFISITIPNSITKIGEYAFLDCIALTSITIPNSVTSIELSTFSGCIALTSVTIPNSVISIGNDAFYGCTNLASITIPNSVTTIGNRTFWECTSLTSISIPNSVTNIGDEAFYGCKSLNSITIPNSIVRIGGSAFNGYDLKEVISKIENPLGIIENTFSDNTFYNATLYVPVGTTNKYKEQRGWKKFIYIKEGNGSSDTPTTQKCEKPTISYKSGKLTFNSATEGVSYQYSITDSDIKAGSSQDVTLSVTYNISVYATKSGYTNSETANATLYWIDVEPKTEGITNNIANVRAMAVMIQNEGGQLIVNGVDDGTQVKIFNINGIQEGSAISRNGSSVINTNLQVGSVAIVKIGEKSIKVVLK